MYNVYCQIKIAGLFNLLCVLMLFQNTMGQRCVGFSLSCLSLISLPDSVTQPKGLRLRLFVRTVVF